MPSDADLVEDSHTMDQLEGWTVTRMLRLGVPRDDAVALARAGTSWHEVERLVERGCPPELVVRVL